MRRSSLDIAGIRQQLSDRLTLAQLEAGIDSTNLTTTPGKLVATASSYVRTINISWTAQKSLSNLAYYEVQVSEDGVSWYSLRQDGAAWNGTLDQVTRSYQTSISHVEIPLAGTIAEPQPRTLQYRVRQHTKENRLGPWSDAVSASTRAVSSGDMAADSVTADKIAANQINATHITAEKISASDIIATGTITANELQVNSVTASKIEAGAIDAAKITASEALIERLFSERIYVDALFAKAATVSNILTIGASGQIVSLSGEMVLVSDGNMTLGAGSNVMRFSPNDATYRLWIGDTLPASAPFSVDKTGYLRSTSGKIGGWTIEALALTSRVNGFGAGITLDDDRDRVSIFSDADVEVVVMGYLNGLLKNDRSGTTWQPGDRGFWVRPGDKLAIDGDVEYFNGDWLISNDASYLIQDGATSDTIVRLGTFNGRKGTFVNESNLAYNATTGKPEASGPAVEISPSRTFIGNATNWLFFDGETLEVAGRLVVGGVTKTIDQAFTDANTTASGYADAAETDAIAAAALDATNKVTTAQTNAESYAEGRVGDIAVSLGYDNIAALEAAVGAGTTIIDGGLIRTSLIETDALWAMDILVGSQIRSAGYDVAGVSIDAIPTGFYLGSDGRFRAKGARIEIGDMLWGPTIGGGGATGTWGATIGGGGATGTWGELRGGGGAQYGERGLVFDEARNELVLAGRLVAADGVFSGELKAATGTFSGLVSGGSINIGSGAFAVDSAGNLTATSGTFSGDISGASGTFSGTVGIGIGDTSFKILEITTV